MDDDFDDFDDPTPDEIDARCAAIQAAWRPDQERRRAGKLPWTPMQFRRGEMFTSPPMGGMMRARGIRNHEPRSEKMTEKLTRISRQRTQLIEYLRSMKAEKDPVSFLDIDAAMKWPPKTAYTCARGGRGRADSDPACLVTQGLVAIGKSASGKLGCGLTLQAAARPAKKTPAPKKKSAPVKKASPKKK